MAEPGELRFRPLNVGRWVIWGFTAIAFIAAPQVFASGFARALLSQMGITIIFALSYNMLLGQTGLLSFGHAVYSGLGAYFAIHALALIGNGTLVFPVSALPLGLQGALALRTWASIAPVNRAGKSRKTQHFPEKRSSRN